MHSFDSQSLKSLKMIKNLNLDFSHRAIQANLFFAYGCTVKGVDSSDITQFTNNFTGKAFLETEMLKGWKCRLP